MRAINLDEQSSSHPRPEGMPSLPPEYCMPEMWPNIHRFRDSDEQGEPSPWAKDRAPKDDSAEAMRDALPFEAIWTLVPKGVTVAALEMPLEGIAAVPVTATGWVGESTITAIGVQIEKSHPNCKVLDIKAAQTYRHWKNGCGAAQPFPKWKPQEYRRVLAPLFLTKNPLGGIAGHFVVLDCDPSKRHVTIYDSLAVGDYGRETMREVKSIT